MADRPDWAAGAKAAAEVARRAAMASFIFYGWYFLWQRAGRGEKYRYIRDGVKQRSRGFVEYVFVDKFEYEK